MVQNSPIDPAEKVEGGSLLQLSAIVEESHDAIIGKTLDGVITSWNGGATKMFGYAPDEMIGKPMIRLFPPEHKDELPQLLEKVRRGEVVADYDSVWLRKDGTSADVEFSLSPVHAESGVIIGASLVGRDISVRKQNEARILRMGQLYMALSQCNKAVVRSADEHELFEKICTTAVQFGGMTMAWVGLLDEASKRVKPVASFGLGTKYLNNIQISADIDDPFGQGPTGTSIREKRPVWSQDFQNDPMTAAWRERAKDFGWQSSAALPLFRSGIPVGSLNLYSSIINAFDEDARDLLVEMASDIGFALDNFVNKEELRRSRESLLEIESVVEHSQDGIFGASLEGTILSWNGGAARMYGYAPKEIIGRSAMGLFAPEKSAELAMFIDKIKNEESLLGYETMGMRKNGEKFDVALSISPILAEDGNVISASVVVRDITERKRTEAELKRSEARFRQTMDVMLEGCMIIGFDWTYLYVNHVAAEHGQNKRENLIGRTMPDVYPGIEKSAVFAHYRECMEKRTPQHFIESYAFADGSIHWYEFGINPIPEGIFVLSIDITERKQAEERIKELSEVRSKFIEIISHQLRTPLTGVNWNLETLLKGNFGKLEETQRKFLQATYSASKEITRHVHSLLTGMDIEEGHVRFITEEVALDSIVGAVLNDMKEAGKLKNLSCRYAAPEEDLPAIMGDGEKIRMAVAALTENAVDYTKENGEISAVLELKADVIRFEIADNGIGIPEAEQHRVFTRFFRASNASVMRTDAFGLGLFIAKNFIEQHHGKIGFESKEGEGSKFWFEIPIAPH